jgi:putative nucleotidyltransferase with HDIG domain/PAS domain S-box-containing protein
VNLRILFVEDSADDVALMLRRLREAGIEPQWDRVQTEAALREALAGERWELALVDYNLPGFGGSQALAVLAAEAPDVPAITVSGAITEETAVTTIKAGAVDYVLKDNLTRLAPAVQRAVEGAELRRQHRRSAESARLALFAVDHASLSIMNVAADGTILYVNEFACNELDTPREDIVGAKVWDYDPSASAAVWPERWANLKRERVEEFEIDRVGSDGRHRVVDVTVNYLEGADCLISYGRDITDRRLAEESLRESEERFEQFAEHFPGYLFMHDEKRRYVYVNRGEEKDGDVLRADWLGRTPSQVWEGDAAAVAETRVQRALDGEVVDFSEPWTPPGLHEHLHTVYFPIPRAGKPPLVGGLSIDVTEQHAAQEALRESEERFEEFAAHFPGYLFMQDDKRRYVYVNRREEKDGDVPREAWFGKTPSQVWEGEDALREEVKVQRALDGEVLDVIEPWMPPGLHEYQHSIYFRIPREGKPPLVGGISIDVTAQVEAQDEIRRQAEQLRRTVEGAVLAMSHVVETRDPYTAGHERRVAELATAIAVEMGLEGEDLTALRLGGLIHDIGKIAVPAEILAKPGRLSEVEFNLIRQHPETGFEILGAIDFGRPVAEMVLQHHERLDGSGYPRGLTAAEIMPEARILAVADVVEAMSSHRPYRAALGMEAALAEVREHAGLKYDAAVVATCVRLVEEQGFAFTP